MLKNRVKELREEAGLTQDELAKMSGISRTMISQLETEQKSDCKVSTLFAIAEVLHKPVSEIFLS